jgi:hypothetical protein
MITRNVHMSTTHEPRAGVEGLRMRPRLVGTINQKRRNKRHVDSVAIALFGVLMTLLAIY